jgi:hypothetical protein
MAEVATTAAPQGGDVAIPQVAEGETFGSADKALAGTQSQQVGAQEEPKHKVKINGVEKELPLSQILAGFQKGEAADERFKSAAQLRQEAEALKAEYAEIDKNPFAYAQKKGINIHQLAEDILIDKMRWEQSSPEQKELAIARQKQLEYEQRIEQLTEKDRQTQSAQIEAKAAQEIDDSISEALGELGMKPTKAIVANIATTLLSYHEAGIEVTPKEVVKRVRENLQLSFQERLEAMSVEEVRALLPKKHLDGLRKAEVESAMSQDPMRSRRKQEAASQPVTARKPVTTDDYFKSMDKKFHGR